MVAGYAEVAEDLTAKPRSWLVTGAAGFIGSHLVERLLRLGQRVRGFDNFATGYQRNLDAVRQAVGSEAAARFEFLEGDLRDLQSCRRAAAGVDAVLHQAALGSVPRSMRDPATTTAVNVDGFVRMLHSAKEGGARAFVYASSSSVYGDISDSPKREERVGNLLSPYAASKRCGEVYADVFGRAYGLHCVGLRYFNVFGARQDPEGPYAAVIPRWVAALTRGEPCTVYGDGETSRDFCFIENVVQANILAAAHAPGLSPGAVYNVAAGDSTSLRKLHDLLAGGARKRFNLSAVQPIRFEPFRAGDVRHSLADVSLARKELGYEVAVPVKVGIDRLLDGWAQEPVT